VTIITGTFILQNNAVVCLSWSFLLVTKLCIVLHLIKIFLYNLWMTQPQDQRGAANGISVTGMSFFKAIGPAAGGIM
jgi:hypothetical protein